MKKKYMIVRINKTSRVQFNAEELLTESCFEPFEKDFETPESAVNAKNKYTNPSQFIVVPYYV
jgi:hypothetical protein